MAEETTLLRIERTAELITRMSVKHIRGSSPEELREEFEARYGCPMRVTGTPEARRIDIPGGGYVMSIPL